MKTAAGWPTVALWTTVFVVLAVEHQVPAPLGAHAAHVPLDEIAARLRRDDPRFARGMAAGRPVRPREYRRTGAWLRLALALGLLVAGAVLGQGLVLATGIVLTGLAADRLDPRHRRRGRGG